MHTCITTNGFECFLLSSTRSDDGEKKLERINIQPRLLDHRHTAQSSELVPMSYHKHVLFNLNEALIKVEYIANIPKRDRGRSKLVSDSTRQAEVEKTQRGLYSKTDGRRLKKKRNRSDHCNMLLEQLPNKFTNQTFRHIFTCAYFSTI